MDIEKNQIIKFAKKYIRDKEVKKAFIIVINTDRNDGHSARIITEGLCWRHPRSKKFQELDTMVMEYYKFG
jgi:hypothetical protein